MAEPGFWDNSEKAQVIIDETNGYKAKYDSFHELKSAYDEAKDLFDLLQEEEDEELASEAKESAKQFEEDYNEMLIATLLDGEYDKNNAILEQ